MPLRISQVISMRTSFRFLIAAAFLSFANPAASLTSGEATARMQGFDSYMQEVIEDWNGIGFGIGVVVDDQLVFARGYGYRDYGRKLPFNERTLFAIGSNTKLFTAVAAGMLTEEGKLAWDRPVREFVPQIQFHDEALTRAVTLRDMLGHRTGISRHDTIWYDSGFTGRELFERLRFLEPSAGLRERLLYNNMMYAAAGHIIELKAGMPWKEYIQSKFFDPLRMRSSFVGIGAMRTAADAVVPYTERRDSQQLHELPLWEAADAGAAPSGAIVSNLEDFSHWLIALMSDGRYEGKQVLPASALAATLQPSIPDENDAHYARGWRELLNPIYGMGREIASYRGHLLVYHGGDLPGFHSQLSYLPFERVGVIVFVVGDHTRVLRDAITYNVYERLLALDQTPWSERLLAVKLKEKQADKDARSAAGRDRIRHTKPSHPLADYAGEYENPAYGIVRVRFENGQLKFSFRKVDAVLVHYHYDRFDTPDGEGRKYAVSFATGPQGEVDKATISLDQAEVVFARGAVAPDPETLARLPGVYVDPAGNQTIVTLTGSSLVVQVPNRPPMPLSPYQGLKFRAAHFSDVIYEFIGDNDHIEALKRSDPARVQLLQRR